ncbi:conserved hypothetical protein [Gammaproteobacteria bacterium]
MTTEKQLIANQQNAQLSTGAITPEGKAIVAKNAIKHGIFAKTFIVEHEKYQENISDYQELLNNLMVNLNPEGQMEYLLVEKISIDYWRMRRILKFETDQFYDRINSALCWESICRKDTGKYKRVFIDDSDSYKVVRYETHLQKLILQNIATLKQLQAGRKGQNGFILQSDANVESFIATA